MQESGGRVEWVGTAGYCENPTQSGASPPPYSLSLWCWWREGFRRRVEETCWGLCISIWADLVSLHSQSIQGPDWTLRQASSGLWARCFTPLEEFGGCVVCIKT